MKDTLCAYYTDSHDIASYMARRLDVRSDDTVLEPSAGKGVLVDAVLEENPKVTIDCLDIDQNAIEALSVKFCNMSSITIRHADTLFDPELDLISSLGGHYTKIIANPPYGAWQDSNRRKALKKRYPDQYVKETYSLFLLRCLSLLKENGRLTFIVPDTFLYLNMHENLRKVLLTQSKIEEIIIFPSKFFPGVSFGYSNLSIITLQKNSDDSSINNVIRVVKGFRSSHEFSYLFSGDTELPSYIDAFYLNQSDVLSNPQHRFFIGESNLLNILRNAEVTLGDVADIVTGFYSGNNKRFIRALNPEVKGSKGYDIVDIEKVHPYSTLAGIDGEEGYIPYIKSSSKTRYLRQEDEWYVRWDRETVSFYNNDSKARFQNSSFYFKTGIGMPMVKSRSIKAFLMKDRVFDQSIVGIFPHDDRYLMYCLALMNSDIVNDLIHTINPTANSSANYIKQIPFILPNNELLQDITEKVDLLIEEMNAGRFERALDLHNELNLSISSIYSINKSEDE